MKMGNRVNMIIIIFGEIKFRVKIWVVGNRINVCKNEVIYWNKGNVGKELVFEE